MAFLLLITRQAPGTETNDCSYLCVRYGCSAHGGALSVWIYRAFRIFCFQHISCWYYTHTCQRLIEELFKYIVVWKKVIQTKFYDEPVDAVEYLIASALGFAVVENILIAFSYQKEFKDFLTVLAFRFLGATLIHAVSSATVGYFLARGSFLKSGRKRLRFRPLMIVPGLLLATVLHGLYNWFIIESQDLSNRAMLGWIAVLLVGSLLWVSWVLWKLNREGTRK